MDIIQLTYAHSNEGMSDSCSTLDNSNDRMSVVGGIMLKTLIGMDLLFATFIGSGIGMDVKLDSYVHLGSCFEIGRASCRERV